MTAVNWLSLACDSIHSIYA